MAILVTGAAGFIGSKVVEFLLAAGYGVVGIDNLNDAYDVRLKNWRLAQLQGRAGFEFHKLDICNREALRAVFRQSELVNGRGKPNKPDKPDEPDKPFDAIINLAARAGVRQSVENPWVYFETNVTGCLNLLDLCREHGVRKFILASTSSLYGLGQSIGQSARPNKPDKPDKPNRLSRPFSESDPTDHPLSPYAASKKAAETLCHTYHYLYGIDVTVLRYFTVYGPAGRPDMSLFRFVQWISEERPITVYGDGEQSRDFTYVDDIARGTVAALKPLGFEVINLGSDRPVVLMEAIRLTERLVDRGARMDFKPRHPADVLATWADIGKAKRLLGWEPQVKFEDGVRQLIEWYRENREWAKEIRTE